MYGRPGDMLSSVCSGAQHLIIAAPYIKAEALTKVLADVSPAASLICITRWNLHDFAAGVSDTECRTIVTERGGSFMLHPSLHAKYYRIDDVILVGSANLTSSAMGWSPHSNLEILCRPGDDFDAETFQQSLFEGAREIGDEEFAHWESIAKIGAQETKKVTSATPRLDTWRPETRDFRHLELAYQGREDEIASFDEQQAAQRDIQALLIPPDLTDGQVRTWASTNLLTAPFTNDVIRLHGMEESNASRSLAEIYNLGITKARRDMETVQSWLVFLMPETLCKKRP